MFDISFNLMNPCFTKDRDEVILRAFTSGVSGMLITNANIYESIQSQQIIQYYTNCWLTVGIHPHNSIEWTIKSAEILYKLVQENAKIVAIGECGLDFNRNFSAHKIQEKAFSEQLALAAELEMPVFLHCRDAHERFLNILDQWLYKLPGAVLHCFTGSHNDLLSYLRRGLYIGITGWICDERRGLKLRSLLPFIPMKRLLLETDAPYLLPRDIIIKSVPNSSRNEPAYLPHILQQVAFWRKEHLETIEAQTDINVRRLLNIEF